MVKVATIGSHRALQIIKGAKDEGFAAILIDTSRASSNLYGIVAYS